MWVGWAMGNETLYWDGLIKGDFTAILALLRGRLSEGGGAYLIFGLFRGALI